MGTGAPLLIAFGLYFMGQHSINGWMHIKAQLRVNNASLFLKALPFNAGAWSLFVLFIIYSRKMGDSMNPAASISQFFIFLSYLSFPHILAIHRFYHTNDKK
jgi:hypothetical protein